MFLNPLKNLKQVGVSESMVVADFGAGAGYYAFALSELVGNSGRVYCIDIRNDLLVKISREAEKKNISNISIILSDIEKEKSTSLLPQSVDLVVVANTFFQVGRKDRLIEEAKRILKTKGRLLLVEWQDNQAGIGPHSKHLVKKEEAISMFQKYGFVLDKEIDAGDHHYGLIFRPKL